MDAARGGEFDDSERVVASRKSYGAAKSQVSFAESCVCDRITFAKWARRNRTAYPPSREKGRKACGQGSVDHFLQSGLTARIAELRRFRAIFRGRQPSFSAPQTEWRRMQSGANLSPREFPAIRENYREFL